MAFSFRKTFPATCHLLASRSGGIFCLSVVGVIALVLGGIHIDALIFRYRAEKLLREVQDLQLRKSGYADAKRLFDKYKDLPGFEGQCQLERCGYRISLFHHQSFYYDLGRFLRPRFSDDFFPDKIKRLLEVAGVRWAWVYAEVVVRNGTVESKGFHVFTSTPDGTWSMGAAATTVNRFYGDVDSPWYDLYPNLAVSLSTQNGKWGTSALFTPEADPAQVREAMDFDLSCLSRLVPCSTPEDMLPGAVRLGREAHEKLARGPGFPSVGPCTYAKLAHYGRDMDGSAVLRVRRVYPSASKADERAGYADYELVEVLKGRVDYAEIPTRWEHISHWGYAGSPFLTPDGKQLNPEVLAAGKQVIAFFRRGDSGIGHNCGVVPATEENLRAVKEGIVQGQE